MIPLFKPIFNREMEDAAIHSLNNEKFVLGESVFKFEEEFARYIGTDYAISTSSGTDALHLALLAIKASQKEVLTCPASFIATANAVLHANMAPLFVDCNDQSYNLDPRLLEQVITEKTAAILPVHLYGNPADMDAITDIADKHSLAVVEDACQAHGAVYKGRKTGSLGTMACFSFYSTKNLTVCGDGGMITTNDKKIADALAKLRNCGRISQYEHDEIGYTSRLNTVNAAIGRVQLKYLDTWNEKRRYIASRYMQLLGGIKGLQLPYIEKYSASVFHLFACTSPRRDELLQYLKERNIQAGVNFPIPIHLQPVYKHLFNHAHGTYPNSERLCREVICLPVYPEMQDTEIDFVASTIRGFFE
jgi:perosamine synthetase